MDEVWIPFEALKLVVGWDQNDAAVFWFDVVAAEGLGKLLQMGVGGVGRVLLAGTLKAWRVGSRYALLSRL